MIRLASVRPSRRGLDTESAVIWRIDRPHALAAAGDELTRRTTYQPLGRFWAAGPATALGRRLAPTGIRPNHITLASAALMLAAAGLVATCRGLWLGQFVPAIAMALALILDTADGHLARLQGTASEFGRWLDANLDELGDLTLHAAIAWSAFARSGHPGWLVVGLVYASAKYLFVFGTIAAPLSGPRRRWRRAWRGRESSADSRTSPATPTSAGISGSRSPPLASSSGRWRPMRFYFAARALGGAARKATAHAA